MYQLNYRILHTLVFRINHLFKSIMEPNQLKHISHFIFLKQKHSNSCIYNWSPKVLSNRFGHSKTKWKRLINIYLNLGWCREEISRTGGSNLVFNPLERALPIEFRDFVANPAQWTARDIHNQLLIFILSKEEKKQKFVAKIKSDLTDPLDVKAHKTAKKLARKYNIVVKPGEKIDQRFVISVYSLGKLFNCSSSYASKLMKKLQEGGLLNIIKNVSKVGALPTISFKYLDSTSSFFNFHGQVYKRELNEYIINYG